MAKLDQCIKCSFSVRVTMKVRAAASSYIHTAMLGHRLWSHSNPCARVSLQEMSSSQ